MTPSHRACRRWVRLSRVSRGKFLRMADYSKLRRFIPGRTEGK